MYIFGKNVAEEYLKKQKKVKKIYLSKNFKENLPFQNIPITYLEKYLYF